MDAATEEIEFIARSEHRVGVLESLAASPRDRADLRAATGASASTLGRVLGDFEARQWVARDGPTYALTHLGEFVADHFLGLREAMTTEHTLRDVWHWLPREMEGFSVDLFADAVVSFPGPRYPYEPVERLTQLIEGTSRLRGFDTIVFKSVNNEAVCRAVLDGMELEYVYSPAALQGTYAWNPERVMEAAARDNCTVLVHDALPDGDRCGIGIVDDRAGICCHDAETGALRAIVDTGDLAARDWAISTFERVRREAEPVDASTFEALVSSELTQ